MKAARFHGRGDIRVDNLPEPVLRPGTVKIRVEWCGICGTDLHEYLHGPVFCPSPETPHPLTGERTPVVLGHEFAGVVVAVADDVDAGLVDQRVAVEPRIVCHRCAACRAGRHNSCERAATIGLQGGGGGLAEFAVVPHELAHPIGDLSTEAGALVEPLAVAYHAVRRASLQPGQTAAVFGAGPIGLLVTAVLKAVGAAHVIVVEPRAGRRQRARAAGADVTIDPDAEDVRRRIHQATDGAGVEVAFECAGVDEVLAACIDAVKAGGTVVNVAIWSTRASIDMLPVVLKEVRIIGTICYENDHRAAIGLAQRGLVSLQQFVTKRIRLDDLVEQGFTALADGADEVKVLVRPGE